MNAENTVDTAQAYESDREYLVNFMKQYLNAIVRHDPCTGEDVLRLLFQNKL